MLSAVSVDSPFIIEVNDERSKYASPLSPILKELKRKHSVAAAVTSGLPLSDDPFNGEDLTDSDDDLLNIFATPIFCSCYGQRSSKIHRHRSSVFDGINPALHSNRLSNADLCQHCGKRKMFDPIGQMVFGTAPGSTLRPRSNTLDHGPLRVIRSTLGANHAESLLYSTPNLRHLSPASSDMQGFGNINNSRRLFGILLPGTTASQNTSGGGESISANSIGNFGNYRMALLRDKANQLVAAELASFMWVLAHEMSLDNYGNVENDVFTSIFSLIHATDPSSRMAGIAALDALIEAPSADEEKKAIKFANNLSNSLRSPNGDFEFLSALSKSLGHMAIRATNVDFVESEITRALEWLRSDRSQRRLAACLTLQQLAIKAPTAYYAKISTFGHGVSNEFFEHITSVFCDPQPIVRACAADAFSQCLKLLVDRHHASLTALLCQIHFSLMNGLKQNTEKNGSSQAIAEIEQTNHGSLLMVTCMVEYGRDFVLPRFDEICEAVLAFAEHHKALIRLEVIRLIPRLGRRCPSVFSRRYLDQGLLFLLGSASTPTPSRVGVDVRPAAFDALGQLIRAMKDIPSGRLLGGSPSPTVKILHRPVIKPGDFSVIIETSKMGIIYEKLNEMFALLKVGLCRSRPGTLARNVGSEMRRSALYCAADLVAALGATAEPFLPGLIDDMFGSGLSEELIDCLRSISESMPSRQEEIEDRLMQEISMCLAGTASADKICEPLSFFGNGIFTNEVVPWNVSHHNNLQRLRGRPVTLFVNGKEGNDRRGNMTSAESEQMVINMSDEPYVVANLALCLRTLGTFGENTGRLKINGTLVPILPFVRDVVVHYLMHPSAEVRGAAALTCCALLIPYEIPEAEVKDGSAMQINAVHAARKRCLGVHSGTVVEEVLTKLLQLTVSDPSPELRLRVVRALDERYDFFLCQAHHIQPLFLLLQDELLVTRISAIQLLGRLTRLNPAPILPIMRKVLADLIIELRFGRSREEAVRLLVGFLRAEPFQRLVHPVLASIVEALPLKGVAPRLASASLEALGELAKSTGAALRPWVKDIIPQIIETMQDQSSVSKQRISLRTLGQIAGSTGYVVRPFLDYPQLLPQATDVLPGTKRAPWALRREVIRTLGIVGALDPEQILSVAEKTRKGGAVGGGYFTEIESDSTNESQPQAELQQYGLVKSDDEVVSTLVKSKAAVTISPIPNATTEFRDHIKDVDDDMPVHLFLYEQYAMGAQPVSNMVTPQRMTPANEDFYPTVAIQALTRIFKDPSLAVHHVMVMQAIMFIFNSLGTKCVPFLGKVVPHMLDSIRTCSTSNLREALLKQIASLSDLAKEHLGQYLGEIFDIVDDLWDTRHLGTILSLVTKIALGVPDNFRKFVLRLVRRFLTSLDEIQTSDWLKPEKDQDMSTSGIGDFETLQMIVRSLRSLSGVLRDYLNLLVTSLIKLVEALVAAAAVNSRTHLTFTKASIETLKTVSHLLEYDSTRSTAQEFIGCWRDRSTDSLPTACAMSARVTQPLVRLLSQDRAPSRSVGLAIIETICVCARQLGRQRWIPLYHDVVRNAVILWESSIPLPIGDEASGNEMPQGEPSLGLRMYENEVAQIRKSNSDRLDLTYRRWVSDPRQASLFEQRRLDGHPGDVMTSVIESNFEQSVHEPQGAIQPASNQSNRHRLNETALSLAWDVSQKASRDDWTEWMRRFALQLLWEAPSPALRATASLAHAYQPLARELFGAAFICCWEELSERYRRDLVKALENAFVADVSPEILQTLLNLAEFMEHDRVGSGLPIDISNLAELARKCRSYAKALHYKEREYKQGGSRSGACVEALISINRKLDLPEAAMGVLKASQVQMDDAQVKRMNDGYSSFSGQITSNFIRNNYRDELTYSVMNDADLSLKKAPHGIGLSEVRESWLAKLGSWSEALQIYQQKLHHNPQDMDAIIGSMRCLDACGEWQQVLDLAEQKWPTLVEEGLQKRGNRFDSHLTPKVHRKFFKFGAQAAWRLADWDTLEKYATALVNESSGEVQKTPYDSPPQPVNGAHPVVDFDGAFFTAIIHIHRKQWVQAATAIDAARQAMDGRFTALMAESYKRAYLGMISAMVLAELEEIIEFRKLESRAIANIDRHPANRPNVDEARHRLLSVWRERLAGCKIDVEVHSQIMAVRSLVLGPTDEVEATLILSELSKQSQMFKLAERVLLDPLERLGANLLGPAFGFGLPAELSSRIAAFEYTGDSSIEELVRAPSSEIIPSYDSIHELYCKQIIQEAGGIERLQIQHKLYFAFVKHLWSMDQREEAMGRLERFCDVVDVVANCESMKDRSLSVACWLELSDWKIEDLASPNSPIPQPLQHNALFSLKRAISTPSCGYRAWHSWALLNFRLAEQLKESEEGGPGRQPSQCSLNSSGIHVVAAVHGFSNAISLGTKRQSASVQQDMLNLLTCLFKYGELPDVVDTINSGMRMIPLEAWLGVLPQLLARIHIRKPSVRTVLHQLLTRLGEKHPQALMYPLSVLLKSPVLERKTAAESLMTSLRDHSSSLVEEALMVSTELIRVAILWVETWHGGLDDASRLYYGEGNVVGMIEMLQPLHDRLERGAETQNEIDFLKSFGQDLAEARNFVKEYVNRITRGGTGVPCQGGGPESSDAMYDQSGNLVPHCNEAEVAMTQAWNTYYSVFKRLNKQIPGLNMLELNQCSPALKNARNLELGVPGTYRVDGTYVKIDHFIPSVHVINSKQRPRKVILRGSDGRDYGFLLKGHEDLRQDERVMQLFGLVNALFARDRRTKKHDLNIQRYAISPLSHNCGIVGWVPHCETLHSMIRDYRKNKEIPLNAENREMLKIAPDYDLLSVMAKVEVLTDALQRMDERGNDLHEILWLKSSNSEEWLERRIRYTRSLAVMSMVGYILGLGDRHPGNLMLDQLSGRVLHIDLGDCFEVAMHRDRFPEKVPFRLTRMLVRAMEVSGIEGSYRSTCERTMSVLRQSRDSLLAMLEAFVYDPLISWRLVGISEGDASPSTSVPKRNMTSLPSRVGRIQKGGEEGVPIDVSRSLFHEAIVERHDEDDGDEEDVSTAKPFILRAATSLSERIHAGKALEAAVPNSLEAAASSTRSQSFQVYTSIQMLAANVSTASHIGRAAREGMDRAVTEDSKAKPRIAHSLSQREALSFLEVREVNTNEEALNEKAVKVIRRVQDKLSGMDLDEAALDVPDQVQRLIVQATSSENLCQLYIGWCAFW